MTTTPVLVTTSHRGVFVGLIDVDAPRDTGSVTLDEARMCIYWGTTKSVLQLAAEGPQPSSRIGCEAPGAVTLTAVTLVADAAPHAWAAFKALK